MKSNNKNKTERYSIYNFIILAILISISTFGVFAQPSNSSEDFCKDQAKQLREKENKAVSLFNKLKKEWESISRNFPANSERKYKDRGFFSAKAQREATKLVDEVLRNGKAEDKFLSKFQWERYKNDVLFAFKYIENCREAEFQALYRSLKKQRNETYERLKKIKTLNEKIENLYKIDEAAFNKANGKPFTFWERIKRGNVRSPAAILKNLRDAVIRAGELGEMKVLLPRLLERGEILTYLKKVIIQRYENHLDMQDQINQNLIDAYFERDCKKCKKLPCNQTQITGNATIISPQNGSTVVDEFDFSVSFDSVPEGVELWSYTWAPLSERYYFFPIDKNDNSSGSFTMRIKVTPSGDGYTFRRGVFLADECTSNEIRKKISGIVKREINGESRNGTVYGPLKSLPKGVKVLQNIKETRVLRK